MLFVSENLNLRVFVTVAEIGNIKEAAEKICRTASAVSMTLKQLEQEVGGPLFESDRKNNLTALGAFVLQTGQTQINNYDKAVATIRAYADNKIGHLTLACVPSVAANLIPSLLPDFIKDRPDVEIELFDIDSRNVRLMIESGQADIGIAGEPKSSALIKFQPLFYDRFKIICNSTNPLIKLNRPIQWSDLTEKKLILNGASEKISTPEYRVLSDTASITVRNVTSLLALINASMGITLLPALAAINLPESVVALELEDINVTRAVGLIERHNTSRSPVAAAFHEFLLDAMPDLIGKLGLSFYNSQMHLS